MFARVGKVFSFFHAHGHHNIKAPFQGGRKDIGHGASGCKKLPTATPTFLPSMTVQGTASSKGSGCIYPKLMNQVVWASASHDSSKQRSRAVILSCSVSKPTATIMLFCYRLWYTFRQMILGEWKFNLLVFSPVKAVLPSFINYSSFCATIPYVKFCHSENIWSAFDPWLGISEF